MINYVVNGNEIVINNKLLKFDYPIYKVKEFNNLIIVLLEFKSNNNPLDFINALYAVSGDGQLIWKMEDVRKYLGKYQPDPLVDFQLIDDKILALDFSSRKYTVSIQDGSILGHQAGAW